MAAREGLKYLVLEKGTIADTIRQYPVGRTLFSTVNELMREGTLVPVREKPTREELLSHYIHFVLDHELLINTSEEVTNIENERDHFLVTTESASEAVHQTTSSYRARNVLFAIGAMAHPRYLNIPGEDLPKVHHLFVEPYPYVRRDALVVGGGNSAAEAASFCLRKARVQRWRFGARIGKTEIPKRGNETLGAQTAGAGDRRRPVARNSL